MKEKRRGRNRTGDFRLAERVSLVLLGQDSWEPVRLGNVAAFRLARGPSGRLGLLPVGSSAFSSSDQGRASLEPQAIKTPWILLMKEGEELDAQGVAILRDLLSSEPCCAWDVAIESMLEEEILSSFEWVTTPDLCSLLGAKGRRYYSLEPRLLPSNALWAVPGGENDPFDLASVVSPSLDRRPSPLVIRRRLADNEGSGRSSTPSDLRLFLDGHARHFDDTRFCPQFQWPWTGYLTMRKEHIPAVERGMVEGWGNPEMAAQALSYMVRFGLYEEAHSFSSKIPELWMKSTPALAQMAALVALASGRPEEAEKLLPSLQEAASLPGSIRLNIAKLLLVLGRDQEAVLCLRDLARDGVEKGQRAYELEAMAARIEANGGRRASLGACVIARDEEAHIGNCISSLGRVMDEILVVDTGSLDRTREVATSLGARVEEFSWAGDFSQARNFALDMATCDYVLMLDADEYISPEHLLNLHVLKALLPVESPMAFRLPIAHIQTRHNWLVFVRAINPKLEKEAVRIIPRISGVRYRGKIQEEVETSLAECGVPVANVAASDVTIFHDPFSRSERIRRKLPLYDAIPEPSLTVALGAVAEYASSGEIQGLLKWLWLLHDRFGHMPSVWPYCVGLARFLEARDPDRACLLYSKLTGLQPVASEALLGLAGLLVKLGEMEELRGLEWERVELTELPVEQKTALLTYWGLATALEGDLSRAADLVGAALAEDPGFLLAQGARFLLLVMARELESALWALEDMAGLLCLGVPEGQGDLHRLIQLLEQVTGALKARGFHTESSMLFAAAQWLERILSQEIPSQRDNALRG